MFMNIRRQLKRLFEKFERLFFRASVWYWGRSGVMLTRILARDDLKLPRYLLRNRYPDLIRAYMLCLCARKILSHEVDGSVAELGVYRGEFATQINECFPDKKLYLFDT